MAKSNSNLVAIFAIISFLLLGFVGYQWFELKELKADLASTKSNLIENEKVQVELEQDYQAALNNLEEMRGTNTDLNTMIDQQKVELAAQKKKVSSLIWTKGELSNAREELEVFRTQAASYAAQIRDLSDKNNQLNASNTQLSVAKTQLETAVSEQTQTISNLSSEKSELTEIKAKIEEENKYLADKVGIGQIIKVNSIDVTPYKSRNNKDAKETTKAKNADFFKTCITTEKNEVVDPGDEQFYLRLISPGGETIYDATKGSGEIVSKSDGSNLRYTAVKEAAYQNTALEACIEYDPDYTLPSGNYAVEVYNKGYLVGESNFLLK